MAGADAVVAEYAEWRAAGVRDRWTAGCLDGHPGAGRGNPDVAQHRNGVLDPIRPRVGDVVARQGGDGDMRAPERVQVIGLARRRRHVERLGLPAPCVGHFDVADDDVGPFEHAADRVEEGVGVGLVEDQVAGERDRGVCHPGFLAAFSPAAANLQ